MKRDLKLPLCKQCRKVLFERADQAIGVCKDCYPPHGAPSCRRGICFPRLENLASFLGAETFVFPRRVVAPKRPRLVEVAA